MSEKQITPNSIYKYNHNKRCNLIESLKKLQAAIHRWRKLVHSFLTRMLKHVQMMKKNWEIQRLPSLLLCACTKKITAKKIHNTENCKLCTKFAFQKKQITETSVCVQLRKKILPLIFLYLILQSHYFDYYLLRM